MRELDTETPVVWPAWCYQSGEHMSRCLSSSEEVSSVPSPEPSWTYRLLIFHRRKDNFLAPFDLNSGTPCRSRRQNDSFRETKDVHKDRKVFLSWKKANNTPSMGNLLNTLHKYRKWIVILFYKFNDSWNGRAGKSVEEEDGAERFFSFIKVCVRLLVFLSDCSTYRQCVTCTLSRMMREGNFERLTRHLDRMFKASQVEIENRLKA